MKHIIGNGRIGYLSKNGVFQCTLRPGKHSFSSLLGYSVEQVPARGAVDTRSIPVPVLQKDSFFAENTVCTTVPAGSFAFVIIDGKPVKCATGCTLVYWTLYERVEIKVYTPDSPELPSDFPRELLAIGQSAAISTLDVPVDAVSLLYYDNTLVRELTPGVYHFWRLGVEVTRRQVTVSRQLLDLQAQELLTADRVTVRVTMALEYRITDPRAFVEGVSDGAGALRLAAQLALRDYVGSLRLEELLEKRGDFSSYLLERLRAGECAAWCSFETAGIKDVIMPGEIRSIMNTVLLAEKQAQASVITRREEVASTRSLLNTARLMEDNPTLMRLKELEYLERICDRVGSISVSGGADLLGELGKLCSGQRS